MPKSKRARDVTLTSVKANRKENKRDLLVSVREAVDKFEFAYVVSFENMRSGHFKELRQEWADSRFFLGKNKVMRIALAGDGKEPYRPGLEVIAQDLVGNVGLLLTSRSPPDVASFFDTYAVQDYARSGFEATATYVVPAGKLTEMPHTLLETFRKLGLPVRLAKGTIVVTQEHTVCEEGKMLTPDQGRLLKLFGQQQCTFKVVPLSRWTSVGGEYEALAGRAAFDAAVAGGEAGGVEEDDA